jgi:hypothetical protein
VAAAQGLFAKGAVVAQLRGGRGWAQGAWGGCGWVGVRGRGCEKKKATRCSLSPRPKKGGWGRQKKSPPSPSPTRRRRPGGSMHRGPYPHPHTHKKLSHMSEEAGVRGAPIPWGGGGRANPMGSKTQGNNHTQATRAHTRTGRQGQGNRAAPRPHRAAGNCARLGAATGLGARRPGAQGVHKHVVHRGGAGGGADGWAGGANNGAWARAGAASRARRRGCRRG